MSTSAEPILSGCLGRGQADAAVLREIQHIQEQATETSVRAYLQEALCCCAVGAFRAAFVLGWCAIAEHLKRILRAIGAEIAVAAYKGPDPRDPNKWDGTHLLMVVRELEILGDRATSASFVNRFAPLYEKRNTLAHPSSEQVSAAEVLALLRMAHPLFESDVSEARVGNYLLVEKALYDPLKSEEDVSRLIGALNAEQQFKLATKVLNRLFERIDQSADRSGEPDKGSGSPSGGSSNRLVLNQQKALQLWKALARSSEIGGVQREALMTELDKYLAPTGRPFETDVVDPSIGESLDIGNDIALRPIVIGRDIVWWESITPQERRVWTYFVEPERVELLTKDIVRKYHACAPDEFKKQMLEHWPDVEKWPAAERR